MTSVMGIVVVCVSFSSVAVARTAIVGSLPLRDQAFHHDQGETSPVVDAPAERLQRGP